MASCGGLSIRLPPMDAPARRTERCGFIQVGSTNGLGSGWKMRLSAFARYSYFHKSFNLGELPSGAAGKRTGFDSESASAALKRWSSSPCL